MGKSPSPATPVIWRVSSSAACAPQGLSKMDAPLQLWLDQLASAAQADFEARNQARDLALQKSRELIRLCSCAIRAAHRDEWDEARAQLTAADGIGRDMSALLAPYPDLFFAGYTQDALKELVEAHATLALMSGGPLPPVDTAAIPLSTYLNGLCEAASELRRGCLDAMRQDRLAEAERLLAAMDAAYEVLMSFSYPDAITGGLRHRVDQLRAVLERTRGDLTNSVQMQKLLKALGNSAMEIDYDE
ncbi:MAG TPA: haloacid dehalogenase [Anaerolineae bacterium]|nr:haloacid dehalogenase [Anaerolineae bacterium]